MDWPPKLFCHKAKENSGNERNCTFHTYGSAGREARAAPAPSGRAVEGEPACPEGSAGFCSSAAWGSRPSRAQEAKPGTRGCGNTAWNPPRGISVRDHELIPFQGWGQNSHDLLSRGNHQLSTWHNVSPPGTSTDISGGDSEVFRR